MAQKRMFDRAIIDTDRFMDLAMSSKALYFLLGMEADDEGFVSFKKVMRIHGGNEDDIKVLVAKNFLIMFESGVVVITDWNTNNYLDKNRIRETEYQKEKKQLLLTVKNRYELNNGSTSIEESSIVQSSIEENKREKKHPYGEFKNVLLKEEEYEKLIQAIGEKNTLILIEELSSYMASKGKRYSSHYATIQTWARRRVQNHQEKLQVKKRYIA